MTVKIDLSCIIFPDFDVKLSLCFPVSGEVGPSRPAYITFVEIHRYISLKIVG